MTEGAKAIGLASTTVLLPCAISTKPVASLNHAYTKLSKILRLGGFPTRGTFTPEYCTGNATAFGIP